MTQRLDPKFQLKIDHHVKLRLSPQTDSYHIVNHIFVYMAT